MQKRIYMDYASLTPVDPRVLREMKRFSADGYANPSSIYKEGVAAMKAMEESRKKAADFLHAHPDELVFTSGGTEANGLALEGAARTAHRNGFEKPHLIISAIEHSSIIECADMMEKQGVEVTRLGIDSPGIASLDELKKAIRPNTFMVSIMTVNNEIGTIQPIREIAKIIRHAREHITKSRYPLFHTDAAQAALYEDLNVERLGVDLLTLDGSKAYGLRGIGALFVKRSTPIEPIIYGGGQERGLRSGTENVPAIAGFALALELAAKNREKEGKRVAALKNDFLMGLLKIRPNISVNGSRGFDDGPRVAGQSSVPLPKSVGFSDTFRNSFGEHVYCRGTKKNPPRQNPPQNPASPHILHVSIPGIDNEFFLFQLDAKGIAVSTKSSCLRDADESYVLKAIGADSKTSIRFSFGRWTKMSDIQSALEVVRSILAPVQP